MLLISVPYKLKQDKDGDLTMKIKSLDVNASGKNLQEVHKKVRAQIQVWILKEDGALATTENCVFQEDHKNPENGILICEHWNSILTKVLEVEPLPEQRDIKSERQQRLETQEHLECIKR